MTGSAQAKAQAADDVLRRILREFTWWNVFGHFQHEVVCEARVVSGHGARWGLAGQSLIGFLEPFESKA